MATPAAILSVLVSANTAEATAKLTKFDRQIAATNDLARKGIEARLGATYDPVAMNAYNAKLDELAIKARDRNAFKAELGANFNNTAFSAYQRSVKDTGAVTKTAEADSSRFAGTLGNLGGVARGAGFAMVGTAIGVGMIAKASLGAAATFQASMERLRTQAGATQKQVGQLSSAVQQLAPAVGTSPNDLALGLYHVVSSMNALLPAATRAQQEMEILKVAAQGAKIGGSNLEDTTYALASAMNALHVQAGAARQTMALLNATVGAGDMTMTDLVESFKSGLVPAAHQVGLSMQSVGAALAVMGDMGMRGAMAGTRLRMSIALLSSPSSAAAKVLDTLGLSAAQATSTSTAMAAALDKAGLNTTQLGADLRKPDGFMVALQDLKAHLLSSGLTATGAAAVMNKAFGGGRMGATITLLAQNTGRLGIKFDQIGKSANKFGVDWKATTQTAAFKMAQMKAVFDSLLITIGQALMPLVPVVTSIALAFGKFVQQMKDGRGAGGEFVSVLKTIWGIVQELMPVLVVLAARFAALFVIDKAVAFANAVTSLAAFGNTAKTTAGKVSELDTAVSTLRGVMGKLAEIGTIVITIDVVEKGVSQILHTLSSGSGLKAMLPTSTAAKGLLGSNAQGGRMTAAQFKRLPGAGGVGRTGPLAANAPPWVAFGETRAQYLASQLKWYGRKAEEQQARMWPASGKVTAQQKALNAHLQSLASKDGGSSLAAAAAKAASTKAAAASGKTASNALLETLAKIGNSGVKAASAAVQTTRITDQTTASSAAASSQATILADMQTLASQKLQAAAQKMSDTAAIVQAKFSAAAQKIDDAATVSHDQAQIIVQGLSDASQVQTDKFAERTLYGSQLIAQKLTVNSDIMKMGFDHQEAVQQKVVDQIKAHWDGTIAADQIRVAIVTAHQDHLTALAQQKATQVQLKGDMLLANATANANRVQLANDINIALKQQAVTLAAGGSKIKQTAAAAALTLAQQQGGKANAIAAQGLAGVTSSTNLAESLANNQYTQAQNKGALLIAASNKKLGHDQGAAQLAESKASAKLGDIMNKASIAEQRILNRIARAQEVTATPRIIVPRPRNFDDAHHSSRGNAARGGKTHGDVTFNTTINGHNKTDGEIALALSRKVLPKLH